MAVSSAADQVADVDDMVYVIIRAGRGIGAEVTRTLAMPDAQLALSSRTITKLERVPDRVRHPGAPTVPVAVVVSDKRQVESVISIALEIFGKLDWLLVTARIHRPIGRTWELEIPRWRDTLDDNLMGLAHLSDGAIHPRVDARRCTFQPTSARSMVASFVRAMCLWNRGVLCA